MTILTRRTALQASASALLTTGLAKGEKAKESKTDDRFQIQEIKTISLPSDRYYGWPTITRRSDGELLAVCSGGRESHVCPFGRVDLIRSKDDGKTWSYARTILDGPIDDRDGGIIETPAGTLLATTFTSLAYVPQLKRAIETQSSDKPSMSEAKLERWQAVHRRLDEGEHQSHLGCWMLRSEDGGDNWSPAYRVPLNAPHGPIVRSDGSLFYAGVALWDKDRVVGFTTSDDDGKTWSSPQNLPVREGDVSAKYHELHAVEAADGRLIVQIRNHNKNNHRETLQTHSTDGGKTWTEPKAIGVWGLPSHLLRLSDDRLLMTYGHRRAPLGNQVRISNDNGETWSSAMILQGDASSGDLGYPSTVEISPGNLVTLWYERLPNNRLAQLRMATWRLSDG